MHWCSVQKKIIYDIKIILILYFWHCGVGCLWSINRHIFIKPVAMHRSYCHNCIKNCSHVQIFKGNLKIKIHLFIYLLWLAWFWLILPNITPIEGIIFNDLPNARSGTDRDIENRESSNYCSIGILQIASFHKRKGNSAKSSRAQEYLNKYLIMLAILFHFLSIIFYF